MNNVMQNEGEYVMQISALTSSLNVSKNISADLLSHFTVRIETHSCLSQVELIKLINYHPKLPFTEEISRGLRVDLSALRTSRTPTY